MIARHIPNALCVLRMALAVPVSWAVLTGRYEMALIFIFIAGVTDGLDGYLARRFGWQSRLGGLLDPAADKLLLATAFISLWFVGHAPGWLLAAVVVRDLVIVTGAGLYHWCIGGFEAEPSVLSKINSTLQLIYVLLTLGALVVEVPVQLAIASLGWAVLVTTVVSGLDYVIRWSVRARVARA